jgi:hypothetical protein
MTSRKRSKNRGDGGTGVYMWEGTTSRVMAADRHYGEFYDFYSVSPEYFGYTLVFQKLIFVQVLWPFLFLCAPKKERLWCTDTTTVQPNT